MSCRTGWIICGALMAVAAAFRICLMSTVFANVDSDQAVLGIMAYHVQRGEHPVFYYGQPYTGSLEAYAAAFLFSVFGANDLTLRLPALAFSVAFVGAVYWLGAVLYGLRIAVLAGLFLALGPALLISWTTAAGAGYIEVMVCGTLLLLLAVRYPDLRAMPLTVASAGGLLVGLGVWMEPLIAEYLLPLAVVYVLRLFVAWVVGGVRNRAGARFGWTCLARALVAITAGIAIGSAPFLVYNLRHHWVTLAYLSHYTSGGDHLAVAVRLVTQSLPVLLGLALPATENESPAVFTYQMARHALPYVAGLVAGAYILGRLVLEPGGLPLRIAALGRVPGTRDLGAPQDGAAAPTPLQAPLRWSRPSTDRDGVLALFAVSCLLFFLLSHFGAMYTATRTPRYLLPLYTVTPLVLDCLMPRRPGRAGTWSAVLATGALVTASLTITLATAPRRPIADLTRLLEARHVRVAYANDYWIVYRISFETHERVLAVGVGDNLRLGLVRIPSDLDVAARTPANRLAWIFFAGRPAGERNFRLLLQHEHIRASRLVWADRTIYAHLSRPVRAAGPYATKGF